MVDVVMKMKFSISEYSQVFNRVGRSYGALAKFSIIDQCFGLLAGYNLVLLMLSFIQLAVYQLCTDLISDCNNNKNNNINIFTI
jgi:hypothetical protein